MAIIPDLNELTPDDLEFAIYNPWMAPTFGSEVKSAFLHEVEKNRKPILLTPGGMANIEAVNGKYEYNHKGLNLLSGMRMPHSWKQMSRRDLMM